MWFKNLQLYRLSAGGIIWAYHPVGLGKASSLLLVFVGVAVFNMRLNNRG